MTNSILDRLKLYQQLLEQKLQEDNAISHGLGKIESRTGVRKIYIAYGIISLFLINLLVGYGANLLVLAVGIFYPAYRSVKAIESESKLDDTRWLTYWVVFSSLELFEAIGYLFLYFVPFYSLLKCLFLLFCMAPIERNGSVLIYNACIKPLAMKHSDKIDGFIDQTTGAATDFFDKSKSLYVAYPVVMGTHQESSEFVVTTKN